MEMVEPSLVVSPFRDLVEQHEVLGTEVEVARWAAEIEALVLAQVALSVLAQMSAPLAARWGEPQPERRLAARSGSDQCLAVLEPGRDPLAGSRASSGSPASPDRAKAALKASEQLPPRFAEALKRLHSRRADYAVVSERPIMISRKCETAHRFDSSSVSTGRCLRHFGDRLAHLSQQIAARTVIGEQRLELFRS